jgi:glycerol-3-phosphate acyltransferase PlsY
MTLYFIVFIIGYLLGSIPFGYLLVKTFRGEDIRLTGSGNIGATNVVRSGAKGLGIATLVLDAFKGTLAVWLAAWVTTSFHNQYLGGYLPIPVFRIMSVAALAAVLGHMFPVWLKFHGGKGVATAVGVFIVLVPKALLVALVVFVLAVALTRYVSLGSVLSAIVVPFASYTIEHTGWRSLLSICAICVLVIIKHHQNIRRLLAGNENRLGGSKISAPERRA